MSTLKVQIRGQLGVDGQLLELARDMMNEKPFTAESKGLEPLIELWKQNGVDVDVELLGAPDEELEQHQVLISVGPISVVVDLDVLNRALRAFDSK
ncbi:hypothetical protein UFOVP650_27 [uncultured Caudovirales phage]|uniref:Uncharacterized protein n=1 Tax=uncultured Caudovirales phage TaxID=2100421 RepID=A0A6J5NCI4_9CAUD|nr:hypothetical protein UFOVP650_27 [uncultured Caudovirales phage]